MPKAVLKSLRRILLAGFLVGAVNGTHAYLKDNKDFNFEAGSDALFGVFIVSGLSGAVTYIMRSPLETGAKDDDTSNE